MRLTIEGNYCLCPKNDGAKRVLDMGTGTGIWAMEYLSHPTAPSNHLEPGGYFEAQDMRLPLECDDGTLREDSDLWIWMSLVMEAMENLGRPVVAAQQWKPFMEEVGFEGVVEVNYKWPINRWPRDRKYKELGTWSLANMDQALESSTLAPLTRGLGWSREEVLVLISKARKVLRDTKVHAYWPM
ncbi:hypothetical protein CMQ_7212 [Grosmannia clavigera kw1407]|uniref:Methyltransferase domain-containing protein n=1 Tax=Grosmannia clavigera (strain kw1407 / UAMH 11150) TaxID=655863 RepID=F0XNR6_GROCL|nr:uncharacterized protein CMQ_7212 [Grosmannia clavigera kw1407]EFX00210.1 hypothetical protein CMQ_7212 [Grosmannia clavigera kw1407]